MKCVNIIAKPVYTWKQLVRECMATIGDLLKIFVYRRSKVLSDKILAENTAFGRGNW